MNSCKGVCERRPQTIGDRKTRPRARQVAIYARGDKYCSLCRAAWKECERRHCMCCGTKLRTRPVNMRRSMLGARA